MATRKALDIQARLAEMEAKIAEADARAAAAEKRAAAAEARASEGKASRPAFAVLQHDPQYEAGKARQALPNGKDVTLLMTRSKQGEYFLDVTYDRRFVEMDGKKRPTRGLNARPGEVAYVLNWIVQNPDDVAQWLEWSQGIAGTTK